jgi:hypothetical protein
MEKLVTFEHVINFALSDVNGHKMMVLGFKAEELEELLKRKVCKRGVFELWAQGKAMVIGIAICKNLMSKSLLF